MPLNWYKKANQESEIDSHINRVLEADMRYPIFITRDYEIIDGAHRALRAKLSGRNMSAIILDQEDLDRVKLLPQSEYSGQVYEDKAGNKYAVKSIINFFSRKPYTTMNPDVVLDKSQDVWDNISIQEVMEKAQDRLNQ